MRTALLGVIILCLCGCESDGFLTAFRASGTGATPDIQHENYEGVQDLSGMKLMRPEVMNSVFMNAFGVEPKVSIAGDNKNPLTHASYKLYLGGLDYDAVVQRTTDVTPTMALVMNRIVPTYCDKLLDNNVFATSGQPVSGLISDMYRRIRGRPIDSTSLNGAAYIYAQATTEEDGWRGVCVYLFLIDGSALLY